MIPLNPSFVARKFAALILFCYSDVTAQMGDVETVDKLFVPQSLSSLGCPQVLQTVGQSELTECNGRMVHVVAVKPWKKGRQEEEEIMVQLPVRLTENNKIMLENTLVVFYGISAFTRDGVDMTYYQIKSFFGEPDSRPEEVSLQAANLSLLDHDQLKERVGILSLADLGEGAMFTVISTKPYIVGEGENMREEMVAKIVRARKNRQNTYKEEEVILPKRFLPQLGESRLPIIGRYSGMKNTKCGTKTYHDVQFMSARDRRVQNVSLMKVENN
jgi:hypothetical protein